MTLELKNIGMIKEASIKINIIGIKNEITIKR